MSDEQISAWKRRLGFAVGILLLLAALAWLTHYLLIGRYFVGTDDAYIAADSSLIAAKVSGYVTKVAVKQGEHVTKGQLLAEIDPRDYKAALDSATADIAAANASIATDKAELALQQAKISAAQAAVTGDTARLQFAARNNTRYAALSAKGASTRQQAEQAATDLATSRAQLAADQANLHAAQRQTSVLTATLAQAQAALAQAQAHVAQARLNLAHTRIIAPFAGRVGNKTVTVGNYLQPGTQIMAIVPLSQVYVLANYKETQITNIRPGQPVNVHVDAFPGLHVRGHVGTVYPASGQEFALLPPDNATGNFTKIVQRVPVKILLDLTPDEIGKLRPGLSVETEIDTRAQP